jgi:hypothetical protein
MSTFQNNLVKLVFILFAFSPSAIIAQPINLVPNPSFEVYDSCPSTWIIDGSITLANPWFQPFVPSSSSDYFNSCDTVSNFWSVPNNWFGKGYQYPKTGQAYAGIIVRSGILINGTYREYLEVELSDSLISGKKYCASFYSVLGEMSNYCTSSIGMYFSSSIILYSNPFFGLISVTPQVANNSLNFLNDTLSWTEVKGEFIANGGEKFLTIGNFNDNFNTPYQVTGFGSTPYYYYYIDDVSVYLCDSTVGLNEETLFELILYPNPSRDIVKLKTRNNRLLNGKVNVSNTLGGILFRDDLSNVTELEIDISKWSNGIYYLTFESVYGAIRRIKLVKGD